MTRDRCGVPTALPFCFPHQQPGLAPHEGHSTRVGAAIQWVGKPWEAGEFAESVILHGFTVSGFCVLCVESGAVKGESGQSPVQEWEKELERV